MPKKNKKSSVNSSSAKPEEPKYTVEKVIDKQVNAVTGVAQYLVKWKEYPEKDNTWELEYQLDCPNLIAEYEANIKQKNATIVNETQKDDVKKDIIGFARGFQPDKIVAATNSSGQLLFLMQWANTEAADLVPAVEANIRCPSVVLDFYEQHIVLLNTNKSNRRLLGNKRNKGNKMRGFDRGLEPEKIIGTTDISGELMFLMKWANTYEADYVPVKQANIRCPRIVIKFYEERLTWGPPTKKIR